jgi:hypothetical protein
MIFVTGFINLVIINTTLDISQSMKEGRRKMYTGSPVRVLLLNNRMATTNNVTEIPRYLTRGKKKATTTTTNEWSPHIT